MKKLTAVFIGLAFMVSVTNAQTNAPVTSTVPPSDFFSGIGSLGTALYNGIEQSGLADATNYAPVAYGTYAPKAVNKLGGGAAVAFNFPALTGTNGSIGTLFGADWLGGWSMVNANVTLKAKTRPLNIKLLSFLPDSVRLVQVEPVAIVGMWKSMGGASGGGTLWDLGADVDFGHWMGGQFTAGATWGEWNNSPNVGHRYHIFAGWRYGF